MRERRRWSSILLTVTAILTVTVLSVFAQSYQPAVLTPDERASRTGIWDFTGGDGSYKRALREGIAEIVAAEPPSTFFNTKTQQWDGIDVVVFNEVRKILGITKVTYVSVEPRDLVPALVSKKGDVTVDDVHITAKRLQVIAFSGPAYYYGEAFAVPKGNPKHIATWADLKGKVVGGLGGNFCRDALAKRTDLKELKTYTQSPQEFADLIAGRLDALCDDDQKIASYVKANPGVNIQYQDIGNPPADILVGYARYGIRKEDIDLNNAISRALLEMWGDGTMAKLVSQFAYPQSSVTHFLFLCGKECSFIK